MKLPFPALKFLFHLRNLGRRRQALLDQLAKEALEDVERVHAQPEEDHQA
jgi:hypothetical protein